MFLDTMDNNKDNQDESSADILPPVKEGLSKWKKLKASLFENSHGRPLHSDFGDSDTISESEEEYFRKMLSERRGSFRPQPKETVPYEVQQSDTLESIAARYNVTPSELTKLNRLSSRIVFPGQTIYVPERNSLEVLEQILKESAAAINLANNEQNSPKPGHVERVPGVSASAEDVFAINSTQKECLSGIIGDIEESKESLRINSKYVTDGEGVVSGVLIVTTNHIIFDPNVSDPLVIEYGMEKYGVEAPMGFIVKAALYTDIFRIKKDSQKDEKGVNVYHSKAHCFKKSKSHDDTLGKSDQSRWRYSFSDAASKRHEFSTSSSNSFQENLTKICESSDDVEEEESDIGIIVSKTTEVSEEHTTDGKNRTVNKVLTAASSIDSDDGPSSRKTSISDDDASVTIEFGSPKKKSSFEKTKSKIHKGIRKLSITESLFSNSHSGRRMSLPVFASLPDFKHKSHSVKTPSPVDKSVKCSNEEKSAPSGPTYVNMVEEKPELFAPLDKLIPRPATSFCDTPLYLCLRMGLPTDKNVPRNNPVVHFGQKMKAEYWFSIPKDNVDSLYHFLLRWFPEKYGEIDNINYEELGFSAIEGEEPEEQETKVPHDPRRASWAFPWRRKSKDVTPHANTCSPEEWEFLDYLSLSADSVHVPELLTPSTILNEEQILEISKHLPARAMNSWSLIYGTTAHGFSLKTMYRKMMEYDCPVLIVIANRKSEIFGALLSSPLKISDHFYGTGESFLFTLNPEFKVYNWSGENNFFIKGNTDSFMVGSSENLRRLCSVAIQSFLCNVNPMENRSFANAASNFARLKKIKQCSKEQIERGHFGLWLDDDLFRGRTNSCQTFANEPLCADQDFEVKSLEAWGFV